LKTDHLPRQARDERVRKGLVGTKRFLWFCFLGELDHDEVHKRASFAPFGTKNASFYQGRLRTIKGKTQKRCVFLQFRTAMSRLGLGLSEQQVVQCIDVLDTDRDGTVSLEEFMALVRPRSEGEIIEGGSESTRHVVRTRFCCAIYTQTDHLTKTGSGQTRENSKRDAFSRSPPPPPPPCCRLFP
jgi:hypothetical protein